MNGRVFVVLLRRPEGSADRRDDPFWEFGSFGMTGCHRDNLLHPVHSRLREGDRLAFIQGGALGSRLLLITPPITLARYRDAGRTVALEALWDRRARPFAYPHAPLVSGAALDAPAELPSWRRFLADVRRPSATAKLSSRFRARSEPLSRELADELLLLYAAALAGAPSGAFIANYVDAVPGINVAFARVNRLRLYRLFRHELRDAGFTADVACSRKCVSRGSRTTRYRDPALPS